MFSWFTSNIGYPDFLHGTEDESARVFLGLAQAARAGETYTDAKTRFVDIKPHQVETKKAGFQEFGLLVVAPRSDRVVLTPLGEQVSEWCARPEAAAENRAVVLPALARALARHQLNNPRPVGSPSKFRRLAVTTDVRPYLVGYYLLARMSGRLSGAEFLGAVCGLQRMADLPAIERDIRDRRAAGGTFELLPAVAALKKKTRGNLRSYYFSHLTLGYTLGTKVGRPDLGVALTSEGVGVVHTVLDQEWPDWRVPGSVPPPAPTYESLREYMSTGVGAYFPNPWPADGSLSPPEVTERGDLRPPKEYEEGKRQLVLHLRIERKRCAGLIKEAKRIAGEQGRLVCAVCEFDFRAAYGDRGAGFIEGHHRVPISELDGPVRQTVADIALVCSNCHRMLHRPPWVSVEALRAVVDRQRGR